MKSRKEHRAKGIEQKTINKGAFRFILCFFAMMLLSAIPASAGVKDTRHNLSVSGPGIIKAVAETQICIFCHTPHNARPEAPLWNHNPSAVVSYVNYWSPTLQAYASEAEAPPIDGFSKLCLGCHDGTIALGAVASREEDIQMVTIPGKVEAGILKPGAGGYLGTDLSGGHPISFIFDEALMNKRNSHPGPLSKLKWPIRKYNEKFAGRDTEVKLYPAQGGYGVQCSSCHDPHEDRSLDLADGKPWPPLWRKTGVPGVVSAHDEVCLVCHESFNAIGH